MLRVTKWVTASFVRSSFLNAFCDKRRACRRMCQGSMFARIASNRIQNLQMIQRTNLSFLSLEEEKTKENGRNRTNVWFFFSSASHFSILYENTSNGIGIAPESDRKYAGENNENLLGDNQREDFSSSDSILQSFSTERMTSEIQNKYRNCCDESNDQ